MCKSRPFVFRNRINNMTPEKLAIIRKQIEIGFTPSEVANMHGISLDTVWAINSGRSYKMHRNQ